MKKRLVLLVHCASVYLSLYYVSCHLFNDLITFASTSRYLYVYNWVLVLLCIIFGKSFLAYNITLGNTYGVFLGEILGELYRQMRMRKLTPQSSAQIRYWYSSHYGPGLWVFIVLFFIIYGIAFERKVIKLRKERTEVFKL